MDPKTNKLLTFKLLIIGAVLILCGIQLVTLFNKQGKPSKPTDSENLLADTSGQAQTNGDSPKASKPTKKTFDLDMASDIWARSYLNAPPISPAEFLKKVKAVRLIVFTDSSIERWASNSYFETGIANRLRQQGIEIRDDAPVVAFANINLVSTKYSTSGAGGTQVTYTRGVIITRLEFRIAANIYRDGTFYVRHVTPAYGFSPTLVNVDYLRKSVAAKITEEAIDAILESIREDHQSPDTKNQRWKDRLATPKQQKKLYEKFTAAKIENAMELLKGFSGLYQIGGVDVALADDSTRFVNENRLKSDWSSQLRAANIKTLPDSDVWIRQLCWAYWEGPRAGDPLFTPNNHSNFYTGIDIIALRQSDVVFGLDGKNYRADVRLKINFDLDFALPTKGLLNRNENEQMRLLPRRHMKDYIQAIKEGR